MANWSYNGHILPELPQVAGKPYQVVGYKTGTQKYYVWASANPFTYAQVSGHTGIYATGSFSRCLLASPYTDWGSVSDNYGSNKLVYWETDGFTDIWANHDVMNTIDGTVHMAAGVAVDPNASITGLTLNRTEVTLKRGESFRFSATVEGSGSFDDSVAFTLAGNHAGGGTTLSETGLLTIGQQEYASVLTVTATSVQDSRFFRTAAVAVSDFLSKLQAEPVTDRWYYSGEELPAAPVFADKPYQIIGIPEDDDTYRLWASASPFTVTTVNGHTGAYATGSFARALCDVGAAAWRDANEAYGADKLVYWETDRMRLCWANHDVRNADGSVYLKASEAVAQCTVTATDSGAACQVTGPTVHLDAACTQLNQTDAVYTVKAWLYRQADGLNTTLPATYTSEAFGGPNWAQRITLTGLEPDTAYGVYLVICVGGAATDHSSQCTFTTMTQKPDAVLEIFPSRISGNGFTLEITRSGLDAGTQYTAEVIVYHPDTSRVHAEEVITFFGDGTTACVITGLEPLTAYAVSVDVYPSPAGAIVVRGDYTVTTAEQAEWNVFAGVSGIARTVTGVYVGVGGVARAVTGIYIGVNGHAQPL